MTSPTLEQLAARACAGDRDALEGLIVGLQDDLYRLAFRMLGLRADAEDATQEILVIVITKIGQFRGESALRTWAWTIATRHLLARKRSPREELASFEQIEKMLAMGDEEPPMPAATEAQLATLAEEVRLSCTEAMVLSLDRAHRVAWTLAEVFELPDAQAAAVLELPPATYRKRLQRARARLGAWMQSRCGLVDPANLCRCRRQIPVAHAVGVARLDALEYAGHPAVAPPRHRRLPLADETLAIERVAEALGHHPDYAAPDTLLARVRALLDSGRFRFFDV